MSLDRWPSGLQAAVKKHGGSGIKNGKFDVNGGYGFKALSYLTGYEATYDMDSFPFRTRGQSGSACRQYSDCYVHKQRHRCSGPLSLLHCDDSN